jgi:hypothetical protein
MSSFICSDDHILQVALGCSRHTRRLELHRHLIDLHDLAKSLGCETFELADLLKLANVLAYSHRYPHDPVQAWNVKYSASADPLDDWAVYKLTECLAYQCEEFEDGDTRTQAVYVRAVRKFLRSLQRTIVEQFTAGKPWTI